MVWTVREGNAAKTYSKPWNYREVGDHKRKSEGQKTIWEGSFIYLLVFIYFAKDAGYQIWGLFMLSRYSTLAPQKKIIWRMFLLGLCETGLYKVRSKSNVYRRSNVLRYSILKSNNGGLSMILQMTQGSGAISLECRKRTSYIQMNTLLQRQGNLWQWEPEPRTRCIY